MAGAAPEPKKRKVAYATYQKWRRDFDRDHKTVAWLKCNTEFEGGKRVVTNLKCSVCAMFQGRTMGRQHFGDRWISGA